MPPMNSCLVAMYHYVRDTERTRFPSLRALSTRDFEPQLDWIGANHAVVSYETFEEHVSARRPFTADAALLTFDDGLIDHYEAVWPRLAARGWSGVFFIAGASSGDRPRMLNVHKTHFLIASLGASAFADHVRDAVAAMPDLDDGSLAWREEVYRYDQDDIQQAAKHLLNYELPYATADRVLSDLFARHLGDETEFARALYLSPPMIKEMAAAGMTFGFHTEHHRVLARLSRAEQEAEVGDGVRRVQALVGDRPVPFCYPYGHAHTYTADTVTELGASGYRSAFTTLRRRAQPEADAPFEIPRLDTRDLPPFQEAQALA